MVSLYVGVATLPIVSALLFFHWAIIHSFKSALVFWCGDEVIVLCPKAIFRLLLALKQVEQGGGRVIVSADARRFQVFYEAVL